MPSNAAIGRAYGERHPDLSSKWTLMTADAAITAHERGDFSQSARLVDAMGRDDRIEGCLTTRAQAVNGLDFELLAADAPRGNARKSGKPVTISPQTQALADEFAKPWARLVTESIVEEILKWRVMLGFAVGELIWYDATGALKDAPQRLKIWHPQFIRWDFELQAFVVQTRDGEVKITHGDGKWVVFGNDAPRPWMRAAARSLWIIWLGRQLGWRDLNLFGERTGQGVLAVMRPAGDAEESQRLVRQLAAMWRGIVADLPQGGPNDPKSELSMLETGADEEVFEVIMTKAETCIAIRLLGQNLTTEVQGGSYAATKEHGKVRQDFVEADTDGLSTDTQTGITEPWAERRAGSRDLAPYPYWQAEEPEDIKAVAEGQKAFGEGIAAVENAGYEVTNVDELAEKHGLKVKKKPAPEPGSIDGGISSNGKPVPPGTAKPANSNVGEKPEPKAAGAKLVASALDDNRSDDPGFQNGQTYLDNLVTVGTRRASEALAIDIANILRVVQAAESPQALRAGLAALYAGMDQTEFGVVLERARTMAELAGKYSVIEDVMT